jgi:hypothetical protein
MDASELKSLVNQHNELKDAILEGRERALDKVESFLRRALDHPNERSRLQAAALIARTSVRWRSGVIMPPKKGV